MGKTFACILHKIKHGVLDGGLARNNLGSRILARGRHGDMDVNNAVLNTAIVRLDNGFITLVFCGL